MRSKGVRRFDREIDDLRVEEEMNKLMLSSLVDVLEEKGIVRHSEWERRIKERLPSK
ncbi:MAG TPA: hypothetical protein VEJ19_02235 [Nitrososphaerales archaeon]|nr:hypothetical protein [Nitrososphaerales archaeon]